MTIQNTCLVTTFCYKCLLVAVLTLTSLCNALTFNVTSSVANRHTVATQPFMTHTLNPGKPNLGDAQSHQNLTTASHEETNTDRLTGPKQSHSKLPLPIIIASPAVAVAIVIFICITYRWHSKQLDEEARQMAMKVAGVCSSPCLPCKPGRGTQLSSPGSVASPESELFLNNRITTVSTRTSIAESEVFLEARSKPGSWTRSPEHQHYLVLKMTSPTMNVDVRKGSSWSVLSDQDILTNESPRRHSTYMV